MSDRTIEVTRCQVETALRQAAGELEVIDDAAPGLTVKGPLDQQMIEFAYQLACIVLDGQNYDPNSHAIGEEVAVIVRGMVAVAGAVRFPAVSVLERPERVTDPVEPDGEQVDRWLTEQHAKFRADLAEVLDVEAGLREILERDS